MKRIGFALMLLCAASALAAAKKDIPLLGAFVRSDRLNVRREPQKTEELIGNVRYRRGDRSARSDWALYDHASGVLKARGHILAQQRLDNGQILSAWGDHATHDMNSEKGFLVKSNPREKIQYERTFPEKRNPDRGSALRMDWDSKAQTVLLRGDVHSKGDEGQFWADRALYVFNRRTLYLDDRRPVITAVQPTWSGAAQADRITATDDPGRVYGEGNTRGWVIFPEDGARSKKKKNGTHRARNP